MQLKNNKKHQVNRSYLHDTPYELHSLYGLYCALLDSVTRMLPTSLLFTVYIRGLYKIFKKRCLLKNLSNVLSYMQIDKSFLTEREVCAVISNAV